MSGDPKILLLQERFQEEHRYISGVAGQMMAAESRGQLGAVLAAEALKYSMFDLQVISGRLIQEVNRLPSPYRENVRPFFMEQVFGAYHSLLVLHRAGEWPRLTSRFENKENLVNFCRMVPDGCFAWDEPGERSPSFFYHPKFRLFYYLMAAFTMFVLEKPGHPAGMPFPGGFSVEQRGDSYYCLIRDKEKEVFYSICNFCPALQTKEPGTG